jgi:hypothetical protein
MIPGDIPAPQPIELHPARLPTLTATAGGRTGLRSESGVNVGSGARLAVCEPTKSGSVAHSSVLRLIARAAMAVLKAPLAKRPADEPSGDYPPPSDCWPMDAIREGAADLFDARDHERAARLLARGGMAITTAGVGEVDAMLRAVRGEGGSFHARKYVGKPTRLSPGKRAGVTE